MSQTSENSPIQCAVVTPEQTLFDEPANFVVLPLYDGEIGIAPGHAPLVGRLGFGEMRLVQGEFTRRFYIEGGFCQVERSIVAVLTTRAIPAERLDLDQLNKALEAAILHADQATGAAKQQALESVQQIKAQIRIRERLPRRVQLPDANLPDHLADRESKR